MRQVTILVNKCGIKKKECPRGSDGHKAWTG